MYVTETFTAPLSLNIVENISFLLMLDMQHLIHNSLINK